MRTLQWSVPIVLALACAGPVRAENPEQPGYDSPLFKKLDANRDGFVSRAEAKQVKGFVSAQSWFQDFTPVHME